VSFYLPHGGCPDFLEYFLWVACVAALLRCVRAAFGIFSKQKIKRATSYISAIHLCYLNDYRLVACEAALLCCVTIVNETFDGVFLLGIVTTGP